MNERLEIYIGKLTKAQQRMVRTLIADEIEALIDNRITEAATYEAIIKAKVKQIRKQANA